MAASNRVPQRGLVELDIFNGNCLEGEGDSFVNSVGSNSDGLPGFQAWTLGCPGVIRGASHHIDIDSVDILGSSAFAPGQHWASGLVAHRPLIEPQAGIACRRTSSIVDNLLTELYDSYTYSGRSIDSVDSSTEASSSDVFLGRSNSGSAFLQELQEQYNTKHQVQYLAQKDLDELKRIVEELRYRIAVQSAKLVRQLRRKDNLSHKLQKNSDIVTACLQAVSQKRHFLDIGSIKYLPALQLLHGNTRKFSIP